jgi:hypothetical protein
MCRCECLFLLFSVEFRAFIIFCSLSGHLPLWSLGDGAFCVMGTAGFWIALPDHPVVLPESTVIDVLIGNRSAIPGPPHNSPGPGSLSWMSRMSDTSLVGFCNIAFNKTAGILLSMGKTYLLLSVALGIHIGKLFFHTRLCIGKGSLKHTNMSLLMAIDLGKTLGAWASLLPL